MEIKITPNQTLKDFSYGRKFVKGLASRSIVPVMLLEAFVEGGRTYQAYRRGGFTEARERFTEEFVGAVFWFSGVPLFDKLINKFVGEKIYKLPETDFHTGKDELRNPFKNYLYRFGSRLKKGCKTLNKPKKLFQNSDLASLLQVLFLLTALSGLFCLKLIRLLQNIL